jgi:hypothetical protein
MKKIVLTSLIVFCLVTISYTQDYTTGIGLRAGFYNGLTVKHFTGERSAFEVILSSRWRGLSITGLYEIHNQAFNTERLNWYYGFGGHVGFWNDEHHPYTNETVIGIDGILGLEYNFTEIPINIGIDWKPGFNIVGYNNYWFDGGALSIRYIF